MKTKVWAAIIAILFFIVWLFIAPLIVVHAWTLIAVGMFGAPVLTYWPAFWGMWALSIIFKSVRNYKVGGNND